MTAAGYRVSRSRLRNDNHGNGLTLWHSAMPVPLYCASLLTLAPAQALELSAYWHDPVGAGRLIEAWIGEQRDADLPEAAVVALVQLYELLERSLWVARAFPTGHKLQLGS